MAVFHVTDWLPKQNQKSIKVKKTRIEIACNLQKPPSVNVIPSERLPAVRVKWQFHQIRGLARTVSDLNDGQSLPLLSNYTYARRVCMFSSKLIPDELLIHLNVI